MGSHDLNLTLVLVEALPLDHPLVRSNARRGSWARDCDPSPMIAATLGEATLSMHLAQTPGDLVFWNAESNGGGATLITPGEEAPWAVAVNRATAWATAGAGLPPTRISRSDGHPSQLVSGPQAWIATTPTPPTGRCTWTLTTATERTEMSIRALPVRSR